MEFRALGPISVVRDGDEIDLGSPRQKAVLALLLIHRNTVLPVERILDELWGDESEGKLNALRVYVSRLRDAFDPDRVRGKGSILETMGNGYRLNVDDSRYDVARFEEMVSDGRALFPTDPVSAAATLRAALDLWTGSPFENFTYDDFVQLEVRRLSELRIDAIEDRIDADLMQGATGELVSEIEVLRQQHPLRERLTAQQALALYRAGRAADALRAIDRFRRHIGDELGIEPSPRLLRLEEQILLHDERIQPRPSTSDSLLAPHRIPSNPFKGLRAFGPDDAASFFGRDRLVTELLRGIGRGQRLIALVGASGSGKSSVVRAGLIPALGKAALEGSDQWQVASMVPGAHPFAELEAALLRSKIDAPASLAAQLDDGATGLVRAVLRILPDDTSRLVLVIDQFEELFTLVDDVGTRDRFLANLVAAVDEPHGRITVVVTLRADFYGRPLAHPEFGARLGSGVVNVTPLTAEELEEAAMRPAEQQGVVLEPALLGQLIADVGGQPGSLPLFQYALTELFDRRVGDTLTAASYRAMGGLEGALRRRASELFDELDAEQQRAARQLFLRLIVVSADDQRSRRRVAAREIASIGVDTATMQTVIRRFGEHRLLSFDADPLTGAPTVEVAHEALITAWPTLDEWVDESRDDLRRHASLATALREWQLAEQRPDYLLPSARLAELESWEADSQISLNEPEREFIAASSARVAALQAEEDRRRADEARSRRRLWALVGTLTAALVFVALILSGAFGVDEGPTVAFFGNRSDDGWNANIAAGLDRAAREGNLTVVDVPPVVEPGRELRELAETGPEIIVTDSFGISFDPTVIRDFPDIRFGLLEADVDEPNASSVHFANEEGAYLAGVVAALKSETGIVGFVGGERLRVIDDFRAGFEAGALSVDPDITVLATFVDQFDEGDVFGFADRELGRARALALFDRGADVIFAAAGHSGFGVFDAALEVSESSGQHVWVIGVDNDQWYDVPVEQRRHVLTSIIKRGDVAAYQLVRHMLDDESDGSSAPIGRLGLADDAFAYSLQGDGLTPDIAAALDRSIDDIVTGRVDIPSRPVGAVIFVDDEGREIERPEDLADREPELGVDGLMLGATIAEGRYDISALGTPVTLTFDDGWLAVENALGETAFARSTVEGTHGRAVLFMRPHVLADPTRPAAPPELQQLRPAQSMETWLDDLIDGVVTSGPERRTIGGRESIYFEAEITDPTICGASDYCVAFMLNAIDDEGAISGRSFWFGVHHRVWWVDQGDEPPVVIVVAAPSIDPDFPEADDLLATLDFGETRPHPIAFADSGIGP